ncbi:Oidioi.mRNA.OKI2018_I69.PAR.g12371.t1.cds [Oikopleura dioica]|uniref:Oidioi.mRNA.OKI2018_I69.PAR.g12371.t1.cds n=1 Tax=Oikopleura dioica TaxID=34765 RepID=A0ABN7S6L8_OIKDI|nr:Oidioi.mRNA.OKI2018_I69.PAR.g12371.t1.cds [Oikopleura dioica]
MRTRSISSRFSRLSSNLREAERHLRTLRLEIFGSEASSDSPSSTTDVDMSDNENSRGLLKFTELGSLKDRSHPLEQRWRLQAQQRETQENEILRQAAVLRDEPIAEENRRDLLNRLDQRNRRSQQAGPSSEEPTETEQARQGPSRGARFGEKGGVGPAFTRGMNGIFNTIDDAARNPGKALRKALTPGKKTPGKKTPAKKTPGRKTPGKKSAKKLAGAMVRGRREKFQQPPRDQKDHCEELPAQLVVRMLGEYLSVDDQEILAEKAAELESAFEQRFGTFWDDVVSGRCRVTFLTKGGRSWNVDGPKWETNAEEQDD